MNSDGIVFLEDRILILPSSINDFGFIVIPLKSDCLVKGVFDSGIIGINKVVFHELNGDGRLAYSTEPHNTNLSVYLGRHFVCG